MPKGAAESSQVHNYRPVSRGRSPAPASLNTELRPNLTLGPQIRLHSTRPISHTQLRASETPSLRRFLHLRARLKLKTAAIESVLGYRVRAAPQRRNQLTLHASILPHLTVQNSRAEASTVIGTAASCLGIWSCPTSSFSSGRPTATLINGSRPHSAKLAAWATVLLHPRPASRVVKRGAKYVDTLPSVRPLVPAQRCLLAPPDTPETRSDNHPVLLSVTSVCRDAHNAGGQMSSVPATGML